jgi:phosphoribosylamine---glycine ligase
MKCLVLGAGGREHALAWKLKQSPSCTGVVLHPGNAGTRKIGIASLGEGVQDDLESVLHQAKAHNFDLVVIGPEAYLAKGYADKFREDGLLVVGPSKFAAQLETSKVFAKEFMTRAGIPTASFSVASSEEELREQVAGQIPIVLKLDGLAAGKGVVVATKDSDVDDFCNRVWKQHEFGKRSHRVVIESCLTGRELSYIGLCDGHRFLPFTSSSDYKRVGDGNTGPNTGGMGVVSPSPVFTEDLDGKIQTRIIQPLLAQFKKDHLFYRGALYVGIMVDEKGNPFVLEFNTRFGDPETQAILPRLKTDFC